MRSSSEEGGSGISELLSQLCYGATEVAARGSRTTPNQGGTLVHAVSLPHVEREYGALMRREATEGSVEIHEPWVEGGCRYGRCRHPLVRRPEDPPEQATAAMNTVV